MSASENRDFTSWKIKELQVWSSFTIGHVLPRNASGGHGSRFHFFLHYSILSILATDDAAKQQIKLMNIGKPQSVCTAPEDALHEQDFIRKHGGDPDDCEEKKDLVERAAALHDKEKAKVMDSHGHGPAR